MITKTGKRILLPSEFRSLREATPMMLSKLRMDALLYTGARFIELKDIKGHPDLLDKDNKTLQLTTRKIKVRNKKRNCRLNDNGVKTMDALLSMKKKNLMPTRETYNEMSKKWCILAGIDPTGFTSKTLRKTWTAWLVAKYPDFIDIIEESIGHRSKETINEYRELPFTDQDKAEMEEYTRGWI